MNYLKSLAVLLATLVVFYCVVKFVLSGDNSLEGAYLYQSLCSDCHGKNGEGLKELYPPLKESDWLRGQSPEAIACLIKNGHTGEMVVNGKIYNQPMPGFKKLTNIDISDLISYINQTFVGKDGFVNQVEITKALKECR